MWMSFIVSDSCYLDSCRQTLLVCKSVALESTFIGVYFISFLYRCRAINSALVSQSNGNPSPSKDQLTRIRSGILYMKPKLLSVGNHDTLSKLGCDCGVCFFNTPEAKIVKNEVGQKTLLELRFGLLGEFPGGALLGKLVNMVR